MARAGSPSLFAGQIPWQGAEVEDDFDDDFDGEKAEWISTDEGEEMTAKLAAEPQADAEPEDKAAEEETDEELLEGDVQNRRERDGREESEETPGVAAAGRRRRVPSSAYATQHYKEMRNYKFRPGTRVTNTVSTANGVTDEELGDFGRPNEYGASTVKKRFRKKILSTVSIDIGTVVGGKRPRFLNGWAFVFHKSYIRRGGRNLRTNTGDHTGWMPVRRLASRAISSLANHQKKVRRELKRGKGSGHRAPVKGPLRGFNIKNPTMLTNSAAVDYFEFRIQGGSGSTPLGNYTHRPDRYGDVIIGVWNPPGSGADGKRFGGSGGVRAFFPLDQKFRLCDTGAITIVDTTQTGRSTWRYVQTTLNGEKIYCWLLQSWTTRAGNGRNF